jgi:hypothetical protein
MLSLFFQVHMRETWAESTAVLVLVSFMQYKPDIQEYIKLLKGMHGQENLYESEF